MRTEAASSILVDKDVMVPMRDGVALATDVYRATGSAARPAILMRLPYNKNQLVTTAEMTKFVNAGYVLAVQDTRGRFASRGRFTPFFDEALDGEDTLAWIAEQDWCSGDVAMAGGSYVGATRWMAAARRPPSLRAIVPQVTGDCYYEGWSYRGGALQLGFLLFWTLNDLELPVAAAARDKSGASRSRSYERLVKAIDDAEETYRHLPLTDVEPLPELAPYYLDWLAHPTYDEFWRATAPRERYEEVVVPSLNVGGWYDCFLGGTLANHRGMRERGGSEAARRPRLIVGPWSHGTFAGHFPDGRFGVRSNAEALGLVEHQIQFFERHVRGIDNGLDDEPPVRIFVMGTNVWRDEPDWPPPDAEPAAYYLHSRGGANTAAGDGTLSREAPTAEPCDVYVYDPADPVPTVGGQTFLPGNSMAANAGPRDQREVEKRGDVLCFTTEPLERDTEVTGPIELILHASSSAFDTDFTGKLVDVQPDGRAVILTDGILRGRYRNSTAKPRLLEPGRVYELRIDLWATANVFKAGHRIRLEVSSSNFPRFDRNTNTGGLLGPEASGDLLKAVNRVLHDAAHPSRLMLPIVDRS